MGMTVNVNFRCRPISGYFEIFTLYSPIVPLFLHDCNCLMSHIIFLSCTSLTIAYVSVPQIISYFKLIFNDNNYNDDIRTIFMVLSLYLSSPWVTLWISHRTRVAADLLTQLFVLSHRSACGLSVYPLAIAIITQPKADNSCCCPTKGRRLGWFTRLVLTHGHLAIQLPTEPGVEG